ncbi:hypothetical protein GOBAR_AA24771 [Gossypium barbadense]|uniref:Uncharacterized protein n=1 Tax=Gossypium barbadense TaxID=3634 RepID=A0A2P5WXU6_GOSBA|nr:hypothetical protein GOBAR_AA24771 [Gossypium barbadense]
MELVDDEDVETMVALYCGTWSNQNAPIQLFVELAGVKETEDPTPLGKENGAQESCMVVPVSYVGSQSTIHGIDIDLNAAPETAVVGDDVYHSSDPSDHEVDSENDEDVETMVALYCGTWSNQNAPIQLFVELAGVKETEDPTPLGKENGAQESCMVVPVSYVGSQSTIHGIDIDLNAAPETAVVGDDVYHSSDPSDHEVDSESDPDVDEVPDDIDDEGVNEEVNVNASSIGNQIRRIMIRNNPGTHMSRIDPNAAHVAEFPEYPEI